MRRCSADVFVSTAGARGGGTGAATLNGVLSCGSIAAQAERISAMPPPAIRAPGPELFFVRLEPAMLAEGPIGAGALSRCRGAGRGRVLPLPGRLHLVRVRDLDLGSEAGIEKSSHVDGLAGQARQT